MASTFILLFILNPLKFLKCIADYFYHLFGDKTISVDYRIITVYQIISLAEKLKSSKFAVSRANIAYNMLHHLNLKSEEFFLSVEKASQKKPDQKTLLRAELKANHIFAS